MRIENTNPVRSRFLRLMVAALIALGQGSTATAQDEIILHGSVRLDADHLQVRLADVADLNGEAAIALGDQILFQSSGLPTRPVTVNLNAVRQRLVDAGANLGLLALSGRECVIRWRSGITPAETPAPGGETKPAPADSAAFASQFIGEPTIRGVVSDYLARVLLRCDPADVQLTFRGADEHELRMSAVGYVYEIKPIASKLSPTIPLCINVFQGSAIVRTLRVTVEVAIRQRVIVVQRYVARGETVEPGDVIEEVRLTPPHLTSPPQRLEDVLGQEAHGRLVPGQILEAGDTSSKMVITRHKEVTVRARHGMFVIRMQGRALEDGRVGDLIRVQRLSDRVELTGVVGGDGEVAIDIGSADSREDSR